jgi:hypothetical protein
MASRVRWICPRATEESSAYSTIRSWRSSGDVGEQHAVVRLDGFGQDALDVEQHHQAAVLQFSDGGHQAAEVVAEHFRRHAHLRPIDAQDGVHRLDQEALGMVVRGCWSGFGHPGRHRYRLRCLRVRCRQAATAAIRPAPAGRPAAGCRPGIAAASPGSPPTCPRWLRPPAAGAPSVLEHGAADGGGAAFVPGQQAAVSANPAGPDRRRRGRSGRSRRSRE